MISYFQKIPFLRPVIGLVTGISVESFLSYNLVILLVPGILVWFILLVLHTRYKYQFTNWFGFILSLLFILLGMLIHNIHARPPQLYKSGIFLAYLKEVPQEKPNSYKTGAKILKVISGEEVYSTNENIILYFQKDSRVKDLKAGEVLLLKMTPQIIKNKGNPYEFNYSGFLQRKKIYRQAYVDTLSWRPTNKKQHFTARSYADHARQKLISIYRNQEMDKEEQEILSALTLGYKHELSPETKRVFSNAGAIHVLAVSGLHVGIIYWLLTMILGFLKKQKGGKIFFIVISISALWSYAFITGLSPSVTRATTMFCIFIIGNNLNRKISTYNSLAASAFLILLFHPASLFEVGFQLSYSAVLGIVAIQPKLQGLFTIKNKILNFFWSLFTVSIAAQIATFPFSIFYFNQFPTYFWISNMLVIPIVMFLIPMGFLLLLLSKAFLLSKTISVIINLSIKHTLAFLGYIEGLPYSTLNFSFHPIGLVLIIVLLFALFHLFKNFKPIYIKLCLSAILLFALYKLAFNYQRSGTNKIIVYNTPSNPLIQLISGKKNYVLSLEPVLEESYEKTTINNVVYNLNLSPPSYFLITDSINSKDILASQGLLFFRGKKIIYAGKKNKIPDSLKPDYVLLNMQNKNLLNSLTDSTLIISCLPYSARSVNSSLKLHHLAIQGAYSENW